MKNLVTNLTTYSYRGCRWKSLMSREMTSSLVTTIGVSNTQYSCQTLKLMTLWPSSTSWNSWSGITHNEFSQKNRFYPDVVETHGEPNIPGAFAVGTRHGSPNGDSENAADSVELRGQQPIRNRVQPLLSITLSMANSGTHHPECGNSGTITPQISQYYE